MSIRQKYLSQLASGTKIAEGRIYYSSYKSLVVGDLIKFFVRNTGTRAHTHTYTHMHPPTYTLALTQHTTGKFVIKQISQILEYVNFRAMLQREGVSAFLPHLKDDDVENGVREYESFKKDTAKHISVNGGVVAFRLRDVQANVMKFKFTRVLYQKLTRVLSQDDQTKWLTRICSGTFAHVYKFKRHVVLARELAGDRDDKRLVTLLKGHAVRILKARLSAKIVSYESEGTKTVSRLSEHPNILRQHVLKSGMSISRLYDESLKQYLKYSTSLDRYGLQAVLMALAQGVSHLHKHGVGHFDIKPSNVLIKWSHTRGVFDATSVVICDFGLVHELGALTDGMYDDIHQINSSIHHIHTTHTHTPHRRQSIPWCVERDTTFFIS